MEERTGKERGNGKACDEMTVDEVPLGHFSTADPFHCSDQALLQ